MTDKNALREKIIGLGEHSFKKSYFPELQNKVNELNLFKAAFEQSNEMFILFRITDGAILYINQAAKSFFQKDAEAFPTINTLINEEFWQSTIELLKDAKNNNPVVFEFEYSPASRMFILDNSISLITNNNEHSGILLIRDITRQKETEQQLLLAKEKAEEGDRLKSAFLANMSHEIRTPMNGIVGFASLLDDENLTREEKNQYTGIIMQSSHDLLRIIDDILDISKLEAGQVQLYYSLIDLNQFIETLTLLYQNKFEKLDKDIQFCSVSQGIHSGIKLYIDELRLKQVLINLLNNAIKFTEFGSISLRCDIKEHYAEFSVCDTGIGIAEDRQKVIFDRFRQSEETISRTYGGTGLGLSISLGLVELMQGKIWLESAPNKGTTFYVRIPLKT